jgi:branched-chain amino acid transport system permease protein
VSTVVLLALTGLGLGALYFLVASGLSLIYGLMGVLNFAHGAFLTVGAYASWWVDVHLASSPAAARYVAAVLAGTVAGGVAALLTEMLIVRRLYERHVEQVLVTVGLALAVGALVAGVWGQDARSVPAPAWLTDTTSVLGASVPNNRLVAIVLAIAVLVGLLAFLRGTRYGLVIRAGVENRAMVTALGIDVRRAFTLVFVIGGLVAGLGGVLAAAYFGSVDPDLGASMLIFAFITVVIGGLGSITGSAVAAVLVALLQQFANYYAASGVGDLSVVLLLAVVLLARPRGLMGGPA